VPDGILRARRGAPAAALAAFLLSFGFAAVDSYIPLMLTDVRGLSITAAAMSIAVAAFTWAVGSWWQSHVAGRRSFGWIVAVGSAFFVLGVGVAYLVLIGWTIALIYLAWALAGFGMGSAFPTIPLAVMAGADEGSEARELSPTLLMDTLGIAVGAGLGGAAITITTGMGSPLETGLTLAFALAAAAGVILAMVSPRIDPAG
jgi:predicted MFS family arabinose efflux permease